MFTKRHCAFFAVLIAVFGISAFAYSADTAKPNTLTADEIADGWLLLFDGESMYGWEPSSKADWKVAGGVISVTSGEKGLLCTTSQWADYVFKVDFRAGRDQQRRISSHAQGAERPEVGLL